MANVGSGSHLLKFTHPEVGVLNVHTGADRIAWGYNLNTQTYPTYAGEVIQILSCFIDDLEITGSVQTYQDMEQIYTYFLRYTQIATQGDPRRTKQMKGRTSFNQEPMEFSYPHRGWQFQIMPTEVPGFRKARDQIHPEWKIKCHVVDDSGDVDDVKNLILEEAEIQAHVGSSDKDFDGAFALKGEITFVDENPFSDPNTKYGINFKQSGPEFLKSLGDHYATFLPSYLNGDFDAIFGDLGSKPSFNVDRTVAAAGSGESAESQEFQKTIDAITQAGKK